MPIHLVDPTFTPTVQPHIPPARPYALEGRVVGLLGNGKPNSPVFLRFIGELLQERFGVDEVLDVRKELTTMPAPEELLAKTAAESELVITGVGD